MRDKVPYLRRASRGRPQPWGVGSLSAHRASAPLWYLGPEMALGAVSGYLKNRRGVSHGQCEAYLHIWRGGPKKWGAARKMAAVRLRLVPRCRQQQQMVRPWVAVSPALSVASIAASVWHVARAAATHVRSFQSDVSALPATAGRPAAVHEHRGGGSAVPAPA